VTLIARSLLGRSYPGWSGDTVPDEMAVDYFLKVDGIPGESVDAKHVGEIDVLGFSWGVNQQTASSSGGGAASGRAIFEDLIVVARTSKASPLLWLACAAGQHIKTAVLTCRRTAVKVQSEFLKITLSDITITSYDVDGTDEEVPTDQVALGFGKVEMTYTSVDATGKLKPAVRAAWDLKANKKV
jgi:type VI secretion system secreted protein Hcp